MSNILIVDDELDIRELMSDILTDEGYTVTLANSASSALKAVEGNNFSTVLLDIWLENSELDGIGVLKTIKSSLPNLPVIMISGHGNIETAVQTIKFGAYDFIEKPFKAEKLIILVERAVKTYELLQENNLLKNKERYTIDELAGTSKQIQHLCKAALNVAATQSRVIITGQDGTGKEYLAEYIHLNSDRRHKNFVIVTASSLTSENFDNEMQGGGNVGYLDKAKDGTLYIDELAHLGDKVQLKLLNLLQNKKYNIRYIAGSCKDLAKMVSNGNFSSNLYYRLNVVPLHIPPLCERKDDVKILLEKFLNYYSELFKTERVKLTPAALGVIQHYNWPGNVRQLKNVAEWLIIMKSKDKTIIDTNDLPNEILAIKTNDSEDNWLARALSEPFKEAKKIFEYHYFNNQLSKNGHNITKVAEQVGINRTALHKKIKSHQLID